MSDKLMVLLCECVMDELIKKMHAAKMKNKNKTENCFFKLLMAGGDMERWDGLI
jgi:hypothetical protein